MQKFIGKSILLANGDTGKVAASTGDGVEVIVPGHDKIWVDLDAIVEDGEVRLIELPAELVLLRRMDIVAVPSVTCGESVYFLNTMTMTRVDRKMVLEVLSSGGAFFVKKEEKSDIETTMGFVGQITSQVTFRLVIDVNGYIDRTKKERIQRAIKSI